MRSWSFVKGQGTRNDFVVVTDRHGMLRPSAADVRHVCDRRLGVGADGLLRAIKATHMEGWDGEDDLWYMDSFNADGSPGVIGGNGLRVFVRHLLDQGLIDTDHVRIATRLGVREARVLPDGRIATDAGEVRQVEGRPLVTIGPARHEATGVVVDVAHAVVRSDRPLAELDFGWVDVTGPGDTPWNDVCFFAEVGPDRVALRHWQRGIGHSVSCGTGAVASAAVHLASLARATGRVVVDVAGGWLEVEISESGRATLYGPAHITSRGEVVLPDAR